MVKCVLVEVAVRLREQWRCVTTGHGECMVSGLGWGEEDARVTCRQLQLPVKGLMP